MSEVDEIDKSEADELMSNGTKQGDNPRWRYQRYCRGVAYEVIKLLTDRKIPVRDVDRIFSICKEYVGAMPLTTGLFITDSINKFEMDRIE